MIKLAIGFGLGYFVAKTGGFIEACKLFLATIAGALTYLVEGLTWLAQ